MYKTVYEEGILKPFFFFCSIIQPPIYKKNLKTEFEMSIIILHGVIKKYSKYLEKMSELSKELEL